MENKNLLIQECKKDCQRGEKLYRDVQEYQKRIVSIKDELEQLKVIVQQLQEMSEEIDSGCREVDVLQKLLEMSQNEEIAEVIAEKLIGLEKKTAIYQEEMRRHKSIFSKVVWIQEKENYWKMCRSTAVGRFQETVESLIRKEYLVQDSQIAALKEEVNKKQIKMQKLDEYGEHFYNQENNGYQQMRGESQELIQQRSDLEEELLNNMADILRRIKALLK